MGEYDLPDFGGSLGFGGGGGFGDVGNIDWSNIGSGAGSGGGNPFGSGLSFSPGPALSSGPVGSSSTDWGGLAGQLFGGLKEYGLPALQAGTGIMGLASGIRGGLQLGEQTNLAQQAEKRQQSLARLAQNEATPLANFSQGQLGLAEQGKIPPAKQAQIDQWAQGAKQRVMQAAAASGQGESSQVQQWLAYIDQQAQAMQAAALDEMVQQGIQAGGTAGGVLSAGAGAAGGAGYGAAGQQNSLEALIAAANQSLARLG